MYCSEVRDSFSFLFLPTELFCMRVYKCSSAILSSLAHLIFKVDLTHQKSNRQVPGQVCLVRVIIGKQHVSQPSPLGHNICRNSPIFGYRHSFIRELSGWRQININIINLSSKKKLWKLTSALLLQEDVSVSTCWGLCWLNWQVKNSCRIKPDQLALKRNPPGWVLFASLTLCTEGRSFFPFAVDL